MDGKGTERRRRNERFPLSLPVEILVEGGDGKVVRYETSNVSAGGAFIKTDTPLTTGTALSVRFRLDSLEMNIQIKGTVVRCQREPSAAGVPPGMAVRFNEKGKIGSRLLRRLLEAATAGGSA